MLRRFFPAHSRIASAALRGTGGVLAIAGLTCSAQVVCAQDTRTVTEPRIPPSCVVLKAEKLVTGEVIAPEYEKETDTSRIQHALDTCKSGQAVELAPGAMVFTKGKSAIPMNAFLSGAIELREG